MDPEDANACRWRTMASMIRGFYPHNGVAFDKSRSWLGHLGMAEELLGPRVNVLVPVRDIRDSLAATTSLTSPGAAGPAS